MRTINAIWLFLLSIFALAGLFIMFTPSSYWDVIIPILVLAITFFCQARSRTSYLKENGFLFSINVLKRGRVYRVYPYPKLATAELGWRIFGLQETHVDTNGCTCYDKSVTYFCFNYESADFTVGNEPKYVRLNSDSILEGVWVQKPGPNHD